MMGKVHSSFIFLLLFLLECPLHVCLPHVDVFSTLGQTTGLPGSEQSQILRTLSVQPRRYLAVFRQPMNSQTSSGPTAGTMTKPMKLLRNKGDMKNDTSDSIETNHSFIAHPQLERSNSWNAVISRRPGLVQVFFIAAIAFSIALICGIVVSYVIHRLVKAEESQQLAMLYENVEIPFLDEKEGSEDDGQDESTHLLPENEKELGKFISSVIRSKRRENLQRKKLREEQQLPKTSSAVVHSANMEDL